MRKDDLIIIVECGLVVILLVNYGGVELIEIVIFIIWLKCLLTWNLRYEAYKVIILMIILTFCLIIFLNIYQIGYIGLYFLKLMKIVCANTGEVGKIIAKIVIWWFEK